MPTPHTGSAGSRYYIAALPTVYSAPTFQSSNIAQYLDVSAAVLSYQRLEQMGKPARLEVLIDNTRGVYNALITSGNNYQPLGLNASLVLSEGFDILPMALRQGIPALTSGVSCFNEACPSELSPVQVL